jgi:hypothetical protein
VSRVVQPDLGQASPPEQPGELVGVGLRVNRDAELIGHDVLVSRCVPVEVTRAWLMVRVFALRSTSDRRNPKYLAPAKTVQAEAPRCVKPVTRGGPQEPADLGSRPCFTLTWCVVGWRDELYHVADELSLVHSHLERGLEPAEREPHRSGPKAGTWRAAFDANSFEALRPRIALETASSRITTNTRLRSTPERRHRKQFAPLMPVEDGQV